ncbi:MAG: hypothetical protein V4858_21795 [Pseudomonadota bacterium]
MPLSAQTLAALQSAGAAIYAADVEIKQSVQDYTGQVNTAMQLNPFDLRNDSLFEDWKTVARLSQAIAQIEVEFRKIYKAASDLSTGSSPAASAVIAAVPTLAAPPVSANGDQRDAQEAQTSVTKVKTAVRKKKRTNASKASKKPQGPLRGNTLKLWEHLPKILNTTDFTKINQSAVAADIGFAKGSIGASILKLVKTGHLTAGPAGAFKLSDPMAL